MTTTLGASHLLGIVFTQVVDSDEPSLTDGVVEDQPRLLVDDDVGETAAQGHGYACTWEGGRGGDGGSRTLSRDPLYKLIK